MTTIESLYYSHTYLFTHEKRAISLCVHAEQDAPRCCVMVSLSEPPGRVAQSVGHLTLKSGVLGSIPGLATYLRFSLRFFKKGSCQLLAKVCARSTG